MVAIRDQGGAANLFAHSNPKDRYPFVPENPSREAIATTPRNSHGARVQQSVDGLVARHDGAHQNGGDNGYPCQVFHLAVTKGESLRWLAPGK